MNSIWPIISIQILFNLVFTKRKMINGLSIEGLKASHRCGSTKGLNLFKNQRVRVLLGFNSAYWKSYDLGAGNALWRPFLFVRAHCQSCIHIIHTTCLHNTCIYYINMTKVYQHIIPTVPTPIRSRNDEIWPF